MNNNTEDVIAIQTILEREIGKYIRGTVAEITNFYSAIRVTNEDWSLNIWIRINTTNKKITLDFSTIEIPSEYRRKGILTSTINNLKSLGTIGKIKITSVLTKEMLNWCIKNGFEQTGELDYTYMIKEN